ncbi:hypothetical protein E1B28_003641 [Marasmius oreades]|uniref:Uncharacterized protein n=1 Tax=Marasmius oreades TaxID=181124 RepID=A0A9P8AAC4_9AGAR|nr:uncharacterized protein E1B28_003641 [Marasmius oreades]KAG7096191.1 hypothetical protein E1B28_003641 [Marasmius oreades]
MHLKHRFVALSTVVAPFLFGTALSSDSSTITCEAAARRLGQPLDGWKIVKVKKTDTKTKEKVKRKRGNRKEVCVRQVADLECEPGVEKLYYHPETRIANCCHESGSVTWYDEEAKLGFCCAEGHHWTGNISLGEGGCCTLDTEMVDGECLSIDRPEKAMSKKGGCGCSGSTTANQEVNKSTETKEESEKEEEELDLNAPEATFNIHYGSCYVLTLVDGTPIGSNREHTIYTANGLFQDIPFKVCRSTDDCSAAGGVGDVVTSRTPFYLKDTMGRFNDHEGKMGWVGYTERKELKMTFSWDEDDAEEFYATKGITCDDKECLKLYGLPLELVFSQTECWGEEFLGDR